MNTARDIEKPAKMIPSQTPVAPRFSAYRGNNGAIIPTPSIDVKMDRARIGKTFFIMWILIYYSL